MLKHAVEMGDGERADLKTKTLIKIYFSQMITVWIAGLLATSVSVSFVTQTNFLRIDELWSSARLGVSR